MKITLPIALWLALAPSLPAAVPESGAASTAQDTKTAALAWLQARGIPFTPDTFIAMCATGGKDNVEPFLAAGLDANTRGSLGTPALVAALSGWQNLMRTEFDSKRGTLVNDRLEVLELLLKHGADPNARDRRGRMAIHHAAAYDLFWPAIAALKQAGADLEAASFGNGLKPLHLAILFNNPSGARALLEAGASPKGEADPMRSFLVNAIKLDRPQVVEVLLQHGADPKLQLPGGGSCLHLAAGKTSIETIQILVAAGADRKAQDAQQRTPYDIAKAEHRGPEVLAALAPAS